MSKFLTVVFIAAVVIAIIAVIVMFVQARISNEGLIKGIIGLLGSVR